MSKYPRKHHTLSWQGSRIYHTKKHNRSEQSLTMPGCPECIKLSSFHEPLDFKPSGSLLVKYGVGGVWQSKGARGY